MEIKKSFSLGKAKAFLQKRSDFMILLVFLLVVGYANWIFYILVYPPLFLPKIPKSGESVFNEPLYEKVMDRIKARPFVLQQSLDVIPPNPFKPRETPSTEP